MFVVSEMQETLEVAKTAHQGGTSANVPGSGSRPVETAYYEQNHAEDCLTWE
jgi:hypothetical protein